MELSVRKTTGVIGAEVTGVDLSKPLGDDVRRKIEDLLLEHLVLAFRDQDITTEEQVRFAKQFGTIAEQPFYTKYGESPDYIVLDQVSPKGEGADSWHSDNSFMAEPPSAAVLRAVQPVEVGGDTCYANMYAAYEDLSEPLRKMIDGLKAVHDITLPFQRALDAGHAPPGVTLADIQAAWPPVEHPVVRTHPITGRKLLYVSPSSTTKILGLTRRESDLLLPYLTDHVRSPDFQCRYRWEPGMVLFWDNRPTQHFAVADYAERRVMHRVALAGERPH
jgi:taurine dioxygenase